MAQIMEMKVNTGEGRLSKEERTIERVMEVYPGTGYRFCGNGYAFFDICWTKVSDHYLIMERSRRHQYRTGAPLKPLFEFPIKILDPETPKTDADRRCFETLLEKCNIKDLPDNSFGVLNQGGRIIL